MPTPEELQNEADAAVRQFSIELSRQGPGTGVRPPPKIEVSEVTLDPKKIGIELDRGQDKAEGGGPTIGPPPPIFTCPSAAQVELVFSGVDVFACSCVDTSAVGGVSNVAIQVTDDFGVNGTFILDKITDDADQVMYQLDYVDGSGLVGFDFWNSFPNDCSTSPTGNTRSDTIIRLSCMKNSDFVPAGVYIEMLITAGHYITFFGYDPSGFTISNENVCVVCPDPDWFSCGSQTAIDTGGSVVWSEV